MSILPKPHDSMLRAEEEGDDDDDDCNDMFISCCEECRLRRDVCDGANAMV